MARPRILISLDTHARTRRGVDLPTFEQKRAYGDAVAEAGGLPLWIGPSPGPEASAYLDDADGLLVSGGDFDIPPSAYGAQVQAMRIDAPKPERTSFETELLRAALDRDYPVLAVCGGMQLLNVMLGGTLIQDLPPAPIAHEQPTDPRTPGHGLCWTAAGRAAVPTDLQQAPAFANSTHHQAVGRLGHGLEVLAVAPDGTIEWIRRKDGWAHGVQWHPELLEGAAHQWLYASFVAAAMRAA